MLSYDCIFTYRYLTFKDTTSQQLRGIGLQGVYERRFPNPNLLRTYLKHNKIPASTDALLFAADRVLHFNNDIKKKLEEGYIVISDRYLESSIAYQSSQSENVSVEWVKTINKFAGKPDLTIILDIDPKLALTRKHQKVLDKFEDTSLLEEVRKVYLNRAKNEGYFVIYTDDIIEIVQSKIQDIVIEKLVQMGIQIKK